MKKVTTILYIGLAGFLILAFYLWKFTDSFKDFGLNLFTEILGIFITIFFIEKLLEKQKLDERKPLKVAAYSDIRLLVNRYISFFQELYRNCVDEDEPNSLDQLFSNESIEKIWMNLDMEAKPTVFPETNMWRYFQDKATDFYNLGSQILNRHGWHLPPEIYQSVHNLTELL